MGGGFEFKLRNYIFTFSLAFISELKIIFINFSNASSSVNFAPMGGDYGYLYIHMYIYIYMLIRYKIKNKLKSGYAGTLTCKNIS